MRRVGRKLLALLICLAAPAPVPALQGGPSSQAPQGGARDFDFNLGTWHTEITRYPDPFASRPATVHLAGTVTVRPVWDGRALLEEIEAEGPNGRWEALTLFLYNPAARQWSQYFANAKEGRFTSAPLIGAFKDGVGELYAQDVFEGRTILVRGVWSDIRPDSHTYRESYSSDGGRSWKLAFEGHLTRVRPPQPVR
jgi:hypothetical protein